MRKERDLPIGVFDSGIGGLTVLRAINEKLPHESTVYLGDTARVPYGTKSSEVVTRYAVNNARVLAQHGIKLLVVACNTASAVALPALQERLDVPLLGVIEPGASRACSLTRSGVVGVIGTEGTVSSGAYQRALEQINPRLTVLARPCPLFVPLAEEGWTEHEVTSKVARIYLGKWVTEGMDTLILGCTHYPVLAAMIRSAVGNSVTLVDSATVVAQKVAEILREKELDRHAGSPAAKQLYLVTDVPQRFRKVGRIFMGKPLGDVRQVDIEPA